MWDALREIDMVSNEQAQFYIACLVFALEHLEEKHIVHRDLKPENVMIDADGYARLIDFGTAKTIEERTFTIVGTPHYMAPEVILGHGYSRSCDMWSLGVMLYEFIYGIFPFGDQAQDPYQVYTAVCNERLQWPSFVPRKHPARPVIQYLLNRKPAQRGTPQGLKKHPWLQNMNWDDLSFRMIEPPYKPSMEEIDTAKFLNGTVQDILLADEQEQLGTDIIPPIESPEGWDDDF